MAEAAGRQADISTDDDGSDSDAGPRHGAVWPLVGVAVASPMAQGPPPQAQGGEAARNPPTGTVCGRAAGCAPPRERARTLCFILMGVSLPSSPAHVHAPGLLCFSLCAEQSSVCEGQSPASGFGGPA